MIYMELETYGEFELTLKLHHISGVNRTMLLWMDKCEDLLIYHMHSNGVYCISNSDHKVIFCDIVYYRIYQED